MNINSKPNEFKNIKNVLRNIRNDCVLKIIERNCCSKNLIVMIISFRLMLVFVNEFCEWNWFPDEF